MKLSFAFGDFIRLTTASQKASIFQTTAPGRRGPAWLNGREKANCQLLRSDLALMDKFIIDDELMRSFSQLVRLSSPRGLKTIDTYLEPLHDQFIFLVPNRHITNQRSPFSSLHVRMFLMPTEKSSALRTTIDSNTSCKECFYKFGFRRSFHPLAHGFRSSPSARAMSWIVAHTAP